MRIIVLVQSRNRTVNQFKFSYWGLYGSKGINSYFNSAEYSSIVWFSSFFKFVRERFNSIAQARLAVIKQLDRRCQIWKECCSSCTSASNSGRWWQIATYRHIDLPVARRKNPCCVAESLERPDHRRRWLSSVNKHQKVMGHQEYLKLSTPPKEIFNSGQSDCDKICDVVLSNICQGRRVGIHHRKWAKNRLGRQRIHHGKGSGALRSGSQNWDHQAPTRMRKGQDPVLRESAMSGRRRTTRSGRRWPNDWLGGDRGLKTCEWQWGKKGEPGWGDGCRRRDIAAAESRGSNKDDRYQRRRKNRDIHQSAGGRHGRRDWVGGFFSHGWQWERRWL